MQKRIIIVTFILVLLSGCIISHKKTYHPRSQGFIDKEKEFAISADSAARICADYRFKKESIDTVSTYLYLIYKDYYVFADEYRHFNPKTGLYYLPGVWVNAKTGKAKRMKGERYVQLEAKKDPLSYALSCYRKQFVRNQ